MSYFGLMALFPALLLMLAMSNRITAATELLSHAVEVYPGSGKFLRETIRAMSAVGTGAIMTCVIVVLWAGSWVFAVIERSLNRIWGATSRTFWHGRALTVGMIGIVGVLLAFSVLVTSVVCRPAGDGGETFAAPGGAAIRCCCRRAVSSGRESLRSQVS